MQQAAIHTDTDMNVPAGILRQSRHFYFTETDLSGFLIESNDHFRKEFFRRHTPGNFNAAFSAFLVVSEINRYKEALRQSLLAPVVTTFRMIDKAGRERLVCWEFHLARENNSIIQAVGYDEAGRHNAISRETEDRFLHLVYNMRQGIVLHDDKERLVLSNKAALKMLGLSETQLNGTLALHQQWAAMYEDRSLPGTGTMPWQLVKNTGLPLRDVVMKISRPLTNDVVWLLVNADAVCDKNGKTLYIITSLSDITSQRQLAKELTEQAIQKQKQITQATIDAQEKERLLIGKELHDNISQHLTTTRLHLEVAKEKTAGEMKEMVTSSHNTLLSIIHELKNLSHALVPPSLSDIGLTESLQDLADNIRNMQGLSATIYHQHFNEEYLPANLKLMLFRIIQEHIQDAARHFGASAAEIRLHSAADAVTLTITDNRTNQDSNSGRKGPVFENITNRVSLFNGNAEETIVPGGGWILTVHIPAPMPESVEN